MKKGSLTAFEMHVEKIALFGAAAFALVMTWMYLIGSPNTVSYNGQDVSPDELDEMILTSAQELESRVRTATIDNSAVEGYSDQLRERHKAGILVDATSSEERPALPPALRLASAFGTAIEVPGLEDAEASGSVKVVTPLRPDRPAVRTGRSLVHVVQNPLGNTDAADAKPEAEPAEPKEIAWVSIAAYFPKKAQRDEMTAAGYAPYRAKVYFVGIDVERQEVLATGEYSEWNDVERGKAMPRIDTADPAVDDETGVIVNNQDIKQTFDLLRASQYALMQPPFYAIEAGDDWDIPPIEGFDVEEEEEEVDQREFERDRESERKRRAQRNTRRRTPRVSQHGRGGERGRRGGIGVVGGGGGFDEGISVSSPRNNDARERREGAKRAREDFKEANRAYRSKEYDRARNLLNTVINNEHATRGTVGRAKKILASVEKRLGTGGDSMAGGPRFAGVSNLGEMGGPNQPGFLIIHPDEERSDPAIWFHDDSVESGKTYRYRMRARLWNRYVGRLKAVANVENAKKTVLAGDWSLPSDPITVAPSTHFFVNGARLGAQGVATIDVWKWRHGEWLKQRFDVEVGDVIGDVKRVKVEEYDEDGKQIRADVDFATGAIVLDLRFKQPVRERQRRGKEGQFSYKETTTVVMVYLDPADGQVKEKSQALDKYDPIRAKLKDQEL
ncbi:MAG: hypothetical protein IH986_03310 [Planctomycetes bacterium]|nr:hypothetical protein [Planctomycetota bacterium]